ncbi:hypothetical protein [Alysiella filiformis]|uniref:Ubiquinone biosynthesis protein UbiJ n=1 Tax=Alysiella filiformis DSM 16848 TaxID=1120981 RepID=A0A286E5R0_9NEIS|nr:hypothetical protein [Alysiella filiformis]QMT30360.1 hypothetical protein H3L97_06210 [Alysiella filiformis]UBQ56663.1 hypothetical protein JF568_02480 [Alysiella filiformis DSM 16848]SOD66201.1 ubiquinone biosynthesis protein UbiJ [Alysiella filiformis DSM 16848]
MLALNIINHLLRQNPEVMRQLSGFNGIVLGIQSASVRVVGRIDANGLLTPTQRIADTVLIVHPQALPKFLQGDLPNFNDLAVEGDMELGMNVMFCFAQIRYAPHQDLRQLLGDDTADKLTAKAAKIGKTLQIVGQTLLFQAASINQASEQARMQHSQMHETLNDCVDELDDLRNEIRIINKRLEQLESSLKSYD